jgi:predicted CoA-binding protein
MASLIPVFHFGRYNSAWAKTWRRIIMAATTSESAHDILRPRQLPLDVFFSPRGVAVVGATEAAGSVGRTVLWNLISTPFGGTVFPVNPKRGSILGIKAYPSIKAVAGTVDLAVIVTPAPAPSSYRPASARSAPAARTWSGK